MASLKTCIASSCKCPTFHLPHWILSPIIESVGNLWGTKNSATAYWLLRGSLRLPAMLLCSSGLASGTARLLSNPLGCLHLCMHFARTGSPHRLGYLPHHPSHTVPTDFPCKIRMLSVANNRKAKNVTIPQLTEIDLFQSCQVQRCHQESRSPDFLFSSPLCGSGNLNRFESLQILNGSWISPHSVEEVFPPKSQGEGLLSDYLWQLVP